MAEVKTVKVEFEGEGGFMVINESDFDPKKHKLYEAKAEKKEQGGKKDK